MSKRTLRRLTFLSSLSDSLIFDVDAHRFPALAQEMQLNSPSYGYYKDEIKGVIRSFASLGCKNYAIASENPAHTLVKVRGFTLTDSPSMETFLTPDSMSDMIDGFLKGESMCKTHRQFQMKLDKKQRSVRSSQMEKKYANDTFDKRFIYNRQSLCAESFPYGVANI